MYFILITLLIFYFNQMHFLCIYIIDYTKKVAYSVVIIVVKSTLEGAYALKPMRGSNSEAFLERTLGHLRGSLRLNALAARLLWA